MIGMLHIHINKDEQTLLLRIFHKTKIGFGECIGNLKEISYAKLQEAVKESIQISLKYYKVDMEGSEPWKNTKYKTWNNFFSKHESISVDYDTEETDARRYKIFLWEKEAKTKSYTTPKDENVFYLSEEEFDKRFYEVFDLLVNRIET